MVDDLCARIYESVQNWFRAYRCRKVCFVKSINYSVQVVSRGTDCRQNVFPEKLIPNKLIAQIILQGLSFFILFIPYSVQYNILVIIKTKILHMQSLYKK